MLVRVQQQMKLSQGIHPSQSEEMGPEKERFGNEIFLAVLFFQMGKT